MKNILKMLSVVAALVAAISFGGSLRGDVSVPNGEIPTSPPTTRFGPGEATAHMPEWAYEKAARHSPVFGPETTIDPTDPDPTSDIYP